jgi:Protein of unknown function with HXXEE motif
MIQRLIANWVYGGFLAAFLLLGLVPLFCGTWPLALTWVFLLMPVYMLHQLEEHDADRFRLFVNQLFGDGAEVLSKGAVFIVNVPGVWGVNLAATLLAFFCDIGFGLISVYLMLVNAVAHIGQGILLRRYNPGLATSILLFLPAAGVTWGEIAATGHATAGFHALGLGSAIVIHIAIVAWVKAHVPKKA